jgi:hypothetical protein
MSNDKWWEDAVKKVKASVTGNICHVCNGEVTKKVQVGRCVYAEPCGHRLYQGVIPHGAH